MSLPLKVKPLPTGVSVPAAKSMMIGPLTPTAARWMWKPVTSAGAIPDTVTVMSIVFAAGS